MKNQRLAPLTTGRHYVRASSQFARRLCRRARRLVGLGPRVVPDPVTIYPEYHLFLAGEPVPSWVERLECDNPTWRMTFAVDCEVFRFVNVVRVSPWALGAGTLINCYSTDGTPADYVRIIGAPTELISHSRHFPPVTFTFRPEDYDYWQDEGEEWKR